MEDGSDAGSGALIASVRTKPMDLGDTNLWKFIDEIRLKVEITGNLTMKVGISESDEGPIEWLPDVAVVKRNFVYRDAVFLTLEFESVGIGDVWNFSGAEFFGEIGGLVV